jgi:galactonate dehydratase
VRPTIDGLALPTGSALRDNPAFVGERCAVDVGDVQIRDLEVYRVKPRWQLLCIRTSDDVCGWSELVLETKLDTVRAALEELRDYLVGKDPRRINLHWQRIYADAFYRGGPVLVSALSAVDIALWDITARLLDVPVYELLGGAVRDKVQAYCHIAGDSADDLIRDARTAIGQGFTAFKTTISAPAPYLPDRDYVDAEVQRFAGLREAIGSSYKIAIDFHGRASPTLSRTLIGELASCAPWFVEEICLPDNVLPMAELRRHTTVPIATGERLFTKWGFRELIERQVADLYQPDICHAGGISELIRIATMADLYYAAIAPHNPLGPLALAASLQVDAVVGNFAAQELIRGLGRPIIREDFHLEDGYIDLPSGAGLGVEIDLEAVKEASTDASFRNPETSYRDGSVANW